MENALGQIKLSLYLRYLCIALMSCLISSCLVPDKFTAILEVSNKAYSLEFIGELRIMVLYTDDYKSGSLNFSPHAQPLQTQVVNEFERVIKERSKSRIEILHDTPEVFKTTFAYTSSYEHPEASGLFNFTISDNILTIRSRHISPEDRKLLQKHNIPSQGSLCIKTTGQVIESNASIAANAFNRCNTWELKNLDDGVEMVIKFHDSIKFDNAKK